LYSAEKADGARCVRPSLAIGILSQSSVVDPETSEESSLEALTLSTLGKHMRVPSQLWPHQQKPSALMMQVPVPQQRASSMIFSRFLNRLN
jgi:hypothetical protein